MVGRFDTGRIETPIADYKGRERPQEKRYEWLVGGMRGRWRGPVIM